MRATACETAFTLFTDVPEALNRVRESLSGVGFEVNDGPAPHSLVARRPSFRNTPASGVAITARSVSATQTTLSVRAWGKAPRDACAALALNLGVRARQGRALQAPGPEELRGEAGYSLADAPARARRELFGGVPGQLVYSIAAGCAAALVGIFILVG